jgi:hypothetical protein
VTPHEIEWAVVLGAVVLAAAATRFDVSPWRIFGLASIATVVAFMLALHVSGEPCGVSDRTGAGDRFFEITMLSSLALYAAASLAGIVDGIRLRKAGDRDKAISRAFGIPVVSGMGVVVLFFALMASIGHCLD